MNSKRSVTLIINEERKDEVIKYYQSFQVTNNGEYILFFAKKDNLTITIYSSKKEKEYKLMFFGTSPLEEAKIWDKDAVINPIKEKGPTKASWAILTDQIGSDEVGTGDLFGPIIVVASVIHKEDIKRLKELGVDDSKRLKDEDILKIGEILVKEFAYSQLCVDNVKYNELVDKGINLNEMKAKLHNQALYNLSKKFPEIKQVFVDQFCEQDKYYKYLSDTKNVVNDITFKTKGESYFPSVAVASIIARYSFLKHMQKMSEKYALEIPFGASQKVTKFAQNFAKKFGKEELLKNVKKNFTNLDEVL